MAKSGKRKIRKHVVKAIVFIKATFNNTLITITDQNGESYRAMEWGNTMVRLTARSQTFAEPLLWYPAASFGDTGDASGAVSLYMSSCAFERGYAPAKTVVVISSSDGPSLAAVLLKAP